MLDMWRAQMGIQRTLANQPVVCPLSHERNIRVEGFETEVANACYRY